MTDKRRRCKAKAPDLRSRFIRAELTADNYRKLYLIAMELGLSLSDTVNHLVQTYKTKEEE